MAVAPVILFHAGFEPFSGGYVGVDVFFVISGYLITAILLADLKSGGLSIARFYERRARRILPALFTMLIAVSAASLFFVLAGDMPAFVDSVGATLFFSSNLLFWMESGYFDRASELKPLLHTWSLAVEEQFYILYPLILAAAWRFGRAAMGWVIAALAALSLLAAELTVRSDPAASFFLLHTRGWELLIGALCALWTDRGVPALGALAENALAALGLALIAFAVVLFDDRSPIPGLQALAPTLGAAAIILFARDGALTQRLLSLPPLVGLGLISYSAYLWHQPLFALSRQQLGLQLSPALSGALIAATLLLAYATWRFVETPFRDRGRISLGGLIRAGGAVGALLLGFFAVGSATEGFSAFKRDDPQVLYVRALNEADAARQETIRAGRCHFNTRGAHRDIDSFIENLGCDGRERGLRPTNVLVFGDSHAADKAMALRLNGVGVWQVGGAGCPAAPAEIDRKRAYCRKLYAAIERLPEIDAVFVANRFGLYGLDEAYLSAVLDYWGAWGRPVVIFTPMPDFSEAKRLADQDILEARAQATPPDLAREARFDALMAGLERPENIHLARTTDFLCPEDAPAAAQSCRVVDGETILYVDADHLSVEGARRHGALMLKDPVIRQLLETR